jgi:asparagine synthase (glutamine-hydrolysing)
MLNGQGGDETFLGYERYFVSYLNSNGFFNFIKNLFSQSKNSRLSLKDIISYFFYFNFNFIRVFNLKRKSLIKKKFIKEAYFNTVKENSVAFKNVKDLQLFELTNAQLPHLLRYEDRNSMRHSIETRLPFLDYRLVEFGISIPIDQKINDGWTKFIIRESYKDLLPEKIIWRKNKFGFEAPDQIWLTKYLSEIKFEIQNSKLLNHYFDTNKMLANYLQLPLKEQWIYLNIARWEKVYNIVVE